MGKKLADAERGEVLEALRARFEANMGRHPGVKWADVEARLSPEKLWSLSEMEKSGGEPDVVELGTGSSELGAAGEGHRDQGAGVRADGDKEPGLGSRGSGFGGDGSERGTGEIVFVDCSAESPKGRRSLCFDRAAWESRKEHKPSGSAMEMAEAMGVEMLSEEEYRALQELGEFDLKTSSWVATPGPIRKLGGAIFCDRRYDSVFMYHNGAESYYASRGFRGKLVVSRES